LKLQGLRDRGLIGHQEYWERYLSISEAASNEEIATQAKIYEMASSLAAAAKSPEQRQAMEAEQEAALSQIDRLIAQRRQMYERTDQGVYADIAKPTAEFDRSTVEAMAQTWDSFRQRQVALAQEAMSTSDRERAAAISNADLALAAKTRQIRADVELQKLGQQEVERRIQAEKNLRDQLVETELASLQMAEQAKQDPTRGLTLAFNKYKDTALDVASATEQAFSRAFQGMEDSLVSFVRTGKLDFSQMADAIISDLIRIQIRSMMVSSIGGGNSLLGALVGGIAGMFGGGVDRSFTSGLGSAAAMNTGGFDWTFSKNGNVFSDAPALSTYRNTVQSSPKFFSFGKLHAYAKGGVFAEAGPEAVMPLARDANGRLGVRAQGQSGAAPVVNVNIQNNGAADGYQATAQTRQNDDGGIDVDLVVQKVILGDVSRNGPITQAWGRTFGMRRSY
jgi:lambda family phage tail tape measure protein